MIKLKKQTVILHPGILNMPDSMDSENHKEIGLDIEYIDDKRIAIRKPQERFLLFLLFVSFAIFGVPFIMSYYSGFIFFSIVFGVLYLASVVWLVLSDKAEDKDEYPFECEFDREKGTLIYSSYAKRFGFEKKRIEIPFLKCKIEIFGRNLYISDPINNRFVISLSCGSANVIGDRAVKQLFKYHSFLYWYMDRCRPLPPGKIFDQYRLADYERRQADGMNTAMVGSLIRTFDYQGKVYQGESDDLNSELIRSIALLSYDVDC